jgi:hypothetical protein
LNTGQPANSPNGELILSSDVLSPTEREREQPVQDYHIPVTRNACSYACRAVWLCSPFSSSDFAEIHSLIVGSAGDDDNRLACAGPVVTLKRRSDVEAAGARDRKIHTTYGYCQQWNLR